MTLPKYNPFVLDMIDMRWLTRENQNRVDSHDPPYERILQYRYMIENKWSQWMDVREEKEP